jgi:hypothetical protein
MNPIAEINPSLVKKEVSPVERAALSAEISNQDPLDPVDHKEFMGQLASLQELEASASLTEGIRALSRFQEMGAASALIGKVVTGKGDDGNTVSGVVDRVTVEGNDVRLAVGGSRLAMANVREIAPASPATPRTGR